MSTIFEIFEGLRRTLGQIETPSLSQRVCKDLRQKFGDQIVDLNSTDFAPDLVIRDDKSALLIEFKMGDSTQPLPASANAQMLTLKEKAIGELGNAKIAEIVPVIVTNYEIDDADRGELKKAGIELIRVTDKSYDSKAVSDRIEALVSSSAVVSK